MFKLNRYQINISEKEGKNPVKYPVLVVTKCFTINANSSQRTDMLSLKIGLDSSQAKMSMNIQEKLACHSAQFKQKVDSTKLPNRQINFEIRLVTI